MNGLRPFLRLLSFSLLVAMLFAFSTGNVESEELLIKRGWRARLTEYKSGLAEGEESGIIWKKMLSDSDFGINLYAIRNLPENQVEANYSALLFYALKSGFKAIRSESCKLLAANKPKELMAECKGIISKSPSSQVAIRSLDALGILESEQSFALLKDIITTSEDFEFSRYALRVLLRKPSKFGFQVLVDIARCEEYSPSLRVEAIGSLTSFRFEENLLFLISLLKLDDQDVIDATWMTLQNITGKAYLPEFDVWMKWWNSNKSTFEWSSTLELPKTTPASITQTQIDNAVNSACNWLIIHQESDGHFDALDYSAMDNYVGGRGLNDTDVCMTALAVLSFISAGIAGDSEEEKERAEAVKNAMEWLVTVPNREGDYRSENPTTYIHEQGAASWALAEYVALGHDEYIDHLKNAINRCMDVRDGDKVWGYMGMPGNTSNSCVTVWFAYAFAAARKAGIDLPRAGWESIADWFDFATIEYNGYIFNASIKEPSEAMTGVGLSAKYFCMFDMSTDVSKRSTRLLLKRPIPIISYYDLYCYSLGLANSEYAEAQSFLSQIQQYLVKTQYMSEGPLKGSWDPKSDIWESSRIYTATMSIPCLTASRRNLAILQDPNK